jgi:hypothetical protein
MARAGTSRGSTGMLQWLGAVEVVGVVGLGERVHFFKISFTSR